MSKGAIGGFGWVLRMAVICLVLNGSNGILMAQTSSPLHVKSAYIYNFLKYVTWQDEDSIPRFVVGLYGSEPELYSVLAGTLEQRKAKEKEISVVEVNDLDQAKEAHVLVISRSENANIRDIAIRVRRSNTLLVTDHCPETQSVMLNFSSPEQGKIGFEINKPNIVYEGLEVSPEIMLIGGTELDVAELYRQMEAALQQTKDTVVQQQQGLIRQRLEIQQQEGRIEEQGRRISDQTLQITERESRLNQLEKSLLSQAVLIEKGKLQILEDERKMRDQLDTLSVRESKVDALVKKIESNTAVLTKQEREMAEQRQELGQQQAALTKQDLRIREQESLLKYGGIIVLLLMALAALIYWSYRQKQKSNIELQKAREEADLANQSKSIFLANMSHEIRTPMNAILGFAEILAGIASDSQQRQYLSTIQSSGKSLLGLINDILDLSKVESGKLEFEYTAVDTHSVFEDMTLLFDQRVGEKGIDFEVKVDPCIPKTLILDEVRIRQVLINLIGNAVKFTDEGGVTVIARNDDPEPEGGKINLQIDITDTGIGIPEGQQDKIFGAFEQQKGQSFTKFGGTGLGLAISKKLVEMMGGSIGVSSVEGEGATFTIRISQVEVGKDASHTDETAVGNLVFEPARILIVDDIESSRQLALAYLKEYDFEFFEATNGDEGVEAARKHHPDLVIMDMRLPVMSGYDATLAMKEGDETRDIPVLALTASVMKEDETEIKNLCDGYLSKPVTKEQLINELTRFIPFERGEETAPPVEEELSISAGEGGKWSLENLDEVARSRLRKLVEFLESRQGIWQEISFTLTINEVEVFANEMQTAGDDFGYQPLTAWGEKLANQAGTFDMVAMPKTLEDYPGIVETLRASAQ